MKNVKWAYWVFTILFAVTTVIVVLIVKPDDRANTALSGVAICISIVAMGLSDKSLPSFSGQVNLWVASKSKATNPVEGDYHVTGEIVNNKKGDPVFDIIYRIRFPKKLGNRILGKNAPIQELTHGYSRFLVDDSFGFLGVNEEENYIPLDFKMNLDEWKSGNIWITVSGSNVFPTTFKISFEEVSVLKKSTRNKPLQAKRMI